MRRRAEPFWRLVPAGALTCAVALFNRFPLTYFDSGRYLTNAYAFAHGVQPPPNRGAFPNPFFYRPISYSLFLTPFAAADALWALPLLQGILAAFTVDLALRCADVSLRTRGFLLLLAGLVVGTSLPWFTGQVMPDFLTGLVILLVFVALWDRGRLERWERLAAAGLLALALGSHLSHLPLYVALVAAALLLRRVTLREPLALPTLALRLAAPLLLAVSVLVASNWVMAGKPVLSESADLFYLARLVGDGTAQRYLDRACSPRRYLLCADRAQLRRDSDWFLWDPAGPWRKYQNDPAFLKDARAIVRGTLRHEWRRQAAASLRSALRQAGKFGTEPGWQRSEAEVAPALVEFGPRVVSAYWASRQGQRALPLDAAGALQKACVWLTLVVLLGCLPALCAGKNRALLGLVGVVFAGLALNALVLGALSSVNARYQSRVIWLVPLLACAAVVAVLENRRRRGAPERSLAAIGRRLDDRGTELTG